LILQGLLAMLMSRRSEDLLILKDLITVLPPRGRDTFGGFVGRMQRGNGNLLIPRLLLAHFLRRTGEGLVNLKDLLTASPRGCRAIFSDLVGQRQRGETDLLIQQGLKARLLRRAGEHLLNLKDLLTVFPPTLERLFEYERVLRPRFCAESRQVPPFSGRDVQIMAQNGGFRDRFLLHVSQSRRMGWRTDFWRT